MKFRISLTALSTLAIVTLSNPVHAFEISFDWSDLKSCTSGYPGTVASPKFTLSDVPKGTKFIRFRLVDRDVPDFNHGGGVVEWNGSKTIPSGSFKYLQPCPPIGKHTYEWQATAQSKKNGGKLGTAKALRKYPE